MYQHGGRWSTATGRLRQTKYTLSFSAVRFLSVTAFCFGVWKMEYDPKKFKELQTRRLADKRQTPKRKHVKGRAALTRSRLMTESVKRFITKTRIELFGKDTPPFSDIESMGIWIMEESNTQPPAEGHAPRYGYKLPKNSTREQINTLYKERPGLYGIEYATLPYPTKDNITAIVVVSDGTRLRRLWLAVRFIAKALDCPEAQATALILAGKLPIVPALSAKAYPAFSNDKPSNGNVRATGKIEMIIREPVSEDEVLRAYRQLRQSLWGDVRDRQPESERDCKLVEFVTVNLDPDNPQWESLMKKWNKEFPQFAFLGDSGYRGFIKAYKDAKRKIFPDVHWGYITINN